MIFKELFEKTKAQMQRNPAGHFGLVWFGGFFVTPMSWFDLLIPN